MNSRLRQAWAKAQRFLSVLTQEHQDILCIALAPDLNPHFAAPTAPFLLREDLEVYEFAIRHQRDDRTAERVTAFCGRRRGEEEWTPLEIIRP